MKFYVFQLLILSSVCLHSQTKGVNPISTNNAQHSTNKYAVVVGISDYQDPSIPDLRFADKDAEAFANYLRSPSGGINGTGLDQQHLKVLINQNATAGKIAAALYGLVDECKEGDQVIIYYSGHGDVERKFVGQPGFLLCWDSPANVYMAGGTIELGMLQSVISTLTLENKAKVLMISDACHAGKLAGSLIKGTEVANTNLARQFSNETKILSCQPNEYSLEGVQWGGGRGAFSYHLINALYGMANSDGDSTITLKEVSKYLDEYIPRETAPEKQNPVILGDKESTLSKVIPDLLAGLRTKIHSELPNFTSAENRGLEDLVLSEVDTNTRLVYKLFVKSLEQKSFFEPANSCADFYYEKLITDPRLKRMHNSLRRTYAAALQDDAQQAVNNIMQMEKTEVRLYRLERIKKYAAFPRQLERAAELLGVGHYQYSILQARKYYFEAWVLQLESSLNQDTVLANKLISKYKNAISWAPDFSPPYLQISIVYRKLNFNLDSCDWYASKVLEISPNWNYAINDIAYYNAVTLKRIEIARNLINRSLKVDSSRAEIWAILASFYYYTLNRLDSAQYCAWKSLSYDSTYATAYSLLGVLEFNGRNNQTNSEKYFQKAALTEKPGAFVYLYLGAIYHNRGDTLKAKYYYEKGLAIEPSHESIKLNLTDIYLHQNEPDKAFQLIQNVLKYDSLSPYILPDLLYIYTKYGYFNEAENICKEAILRNPNNLFYLGDYYVKRGKIQDAEEVYLKWVLLDTTQASTFLKLAYFYNKINNDKKAEESYLKCLTLDSTKASYYNSLGWFYYQKRQYLKAEPTFLKAISLDSNYFLAWINLGIMYNETKRYMEAAQVFHKAISIDSMRVNSWLNLARSFEGLQQYENMEIACSKAITLHPNNAKAWGKLGLALLKLQRLHDAEQAYLKSTEIDSTNANVWGNLGYFYFSVKNYYQCEYASKKAISLDSNYFVGYYNLGLSLSFMNRFEDSEKVYKKAIQIDSLNATSLNNLAWIYIQTNRAKDAEINLLKAIALDTAFVNPHTLLALMYLNSNRKKESKQLLLQALSLDPEFFPAIFGMTYLLAEEGNFLEAFVLLEQAIQKSVRLKQVRNLEEFLTLNGICLLYSFQGLTLEMLQKDEQLSPLRDLPEWIPLMKKYFPDQFKD